MKRKLYILILLIAGLSSSLSAYADVKYGHEYVDLGLPSGLLWATCNVGASKPEEYGNYYAWGETNTKSNYWYEESKTSNKTIDQLKMVGIIGSDGILAAAYDTASKSWGGAWRMPTVDEIKELRDNTTTTWTMQNGVYGCKVTSKTNGNSIFLPAAGYRDGTALCNDGSYGCYWSASYNASYSYYAYPFCLNFSSSYFNSSSTSDYHGSSIRPVIDNHETKASSVTLNVHELSLRKGESYIVTANVLPENTSNRTVVWESSHTLVASVDAYGNVTAISVGETTITATANDGSGVSASCKVTVTSESVHGHEYVDLGLPSGLLWATCNVGASSPEEYGYYDTSNDMAYALWGGAWRTPTKDEIEELINNTTSTWTTWNGVYGRKVTSKTNGNSIFLPAAGYYYYNTGETLHDDGSFGMYFSSSLIPPDDFNNSVTLFILCFSSSGFYCSSTIGTYYSFPVRPVIDNHHETKASSVTINVHDLSMKKGESYIITTNVLPKNTTYKTIVWKSNNTLVATVDSNGKVIAKGVGEATITATVNDGSGVSTSCKVTVTSEPMAYGHEYVDLGLPSGMLWATCNVGASKPEDYGYSYNIWGCCWDEKYCAGRPWSNAKRDGVIEGWGGTWRIPTIDAIKELINNTTSTWTAQNGVYGCKVTSKTNGNSIFLPAAGYIRHEYEDAGGDYFYYVYKRHDEGLYGIYWSSSSHADCLRFDSSNFDIVSREYIGLPIRPVIDNSEIKASSVELINKISLIKGESYIVTAYFQPENTSDKTLEWKSSNTSVALVDSNGKVTAIGVGEATIAATTNDGSGVSASCKVTVTDLIESIDVTDKATLSSTAQEVAGKDINIKQSGVLTVDGTQTLAVKTLSMYFGESNPGALINNSSRLTAGSVIARFAVSANTWHFITPMSDVKIDDVTHSNDGAFIFRQYDAAKRAQNGKGNCWTDVTDGVLHAGQGYILRSNMAGEIIMPMPKAGSSDVFCTTDRSFALNSHAANSLADEDWNFVGNPYPSYFNIQSMDCKVPVTVREGNKYTAYTVTDDNYTLRPMQAFFLQKPDNANTILFHKEGRVSSATSKVRSKMPTDNGRKVFDILLSDGESSDRTRVVINDEASLEYERECDAAKFESEDADAAQIYSIGEHGTRFAINERPMLDGIVELGITLGTHGSYTISLGHGNDAVSLYDAETQQTVELNTTDYEFTASAGECRNRFYLYFDDATNIHSTHSSKSSVQSPVFYNLNGQAVGKNYKGIVISNGKKIVR